MIARATHELSREELEALVRRHEAITAQFRAQLVRKAASNVGDSIPDESNSKVEFAPTPASALLSRRVSMEEVEDEGDLITFSPMPQAGPSRNKGKGPDPGNWGDISSLQNFSEDEMRAQREMRISC